MIWLGIVVGVCGIDFILKNAAEKKLKKNTRKQIGKTGFSLELVHNKGFALNKMDHRPGFVKWTQAGLMILFGWYGIHECFTEKGKSLSALGMALLLGGGASNLYDRVKRGYVVDYLGIPGIKNILFNLSDLFIFLGSFLVFLGEWKER